VAERPAGGQLSATIANRIADMHQIAPQLTEAVAQRITTTELHDKALRDLGAFAHRTVVEDEHTYVAPSLGASTESGLRGAHRPSVVSLPRWSGQPVGGQAMGAAGAMLALRWNRFSGSYRALIAASRSYFCGP
jgi:hypothetical protein